jgi:hypothetical protein
LQVIFYCTQQVSSTFFNIDIFNDNSPPAHKTQVKAVPGVSEERGLNKHTNGLIRQYLPKKIPFDTLTQKQLDKINRVVQKLKFSNNFR